MSKKKIQVQGSIDGLCGIYCLVHFLERVPRLSAKGKTRAHAAFAELLKDAQKLKLLDAENIAGGYYAEDLVRIFNATSKRKRLSYIAAELTAASDSDESASALGLLRQIISEGGAAVVSVHAGGHWVLAENVGADGAVTVRDSGHAAKYRRDELKRIDRDLDGVAIVPRQSVVGRRISRLQRMAR